MKDYITMSIFIQTLKKRLETINSHVCVGLDSNYKFIPDFIKNGQTVKEAIFDFNKRIIAVTHELAVIYKMNVSFYAAYGHEGLEALRLTNEFLKQNHPEIMILADCKRSEMGQTVEMVAKEIFDWLQFDCVMTTPWFGLDTIRDYLRDESKGVLVYIHDSNPSAGEIQDLKLADGRAVYEVVAEKVANEWNLNGNVWAEAGITYLPQLRRTREIIGEEMPLLVAGVGAQGGKPEDLRGLFGAQGKRLIVNSSRGIIFASKKNDESYFNEVKMSAFDLKNKLQGVAKLT